MTTSLSGKEVAKQVAEKLPGSIVESTETAILAKGESIFQVASLLKDTPGLEFDYLDMLAAVDHLDYFEVVYYLVSMKHNHSLVLKARCYERQNPTLPSVVSLWRGADFQEREAYDLMGIYFSGHPNLRRIFLWEGFQGHPLRKDYL